MKAHKRVLKAALSVALVAGLSPAALTSMAVAAPSADGQTELSALAIQEAQYQEAAEMAQDKALLLMSSPTQVDFSDSYLQSPYYEALKQVELTGNLRSDLLAVALSQSGYAESNSAKKLGGTTPGTKNYTEYGRYFDVNGMSWCGAFVAWCADQAGIPESLLTRTCIADHTLFGAPFYTWEESSFRGGSYTPQPGDLILYDWTRNGQTDHVGIIRSVSVKKNAIHFETIEGNSSDKVVERSLDVDPVTGAVYGGKVFSFVAPQYEGAAITDIEPVAAQEYIGKAVKPALTVKANTLTLSKNDYDVTYANNVNVGVATATVVGKGAFEGTATVKFKIKPAKVAKPSVTGKNKAFKLTWKASSDKQADGYEIRYSTDSKMAGAKVVTIKKASANAKTIKKLKAKTYYVQIRAYKNVDSKVYYSSWTAKKKAYVY